MLKYRWLIIGGFAATLVGNIFFASSIGALGDEDKDRQGPIARQLYTQYCLSCHATDGKGSEMRKVMPTLPDFTSRDWQESLTNVQLKLSILEGKGTLMPAYGDRLSGEQANALVDLTRRFATPAASSGSSE